MQKTNTKLKLIAIAATAFMGFNSLTAQTYIINTVAGNGSSGYSGDGGQATVAKITSVPGIAIDASGNLYITDHNNNRIREINTAGIISTIAGDGTQGHTGDGGAATAAELNQPFAINFDASGNLYIVEYGNNCIREVSTSGTISTVAGTTVNGFNGDGGQATAAELNSPTGVVFDASGNMYIADYGNNRIREVNTSGVISTIAGNGAAGYTGDNGLAVNAELHNPFCVVPDHSGNLVFSDNANNVIRSINLTTGIITTIAGNGTNAYAGDGGAATAAELSSPRNITFDNVGDMYFSELGGSVVRKVDTGGIITTIAGNGINGYTGDGGIATSAELHNPDGIAIDVTGKIYIADSDNSRVRELAPVKAQALNFNGISGNQISMGNSMDAILGTYSAITVDAWVNPATVSNYGEIIGNYSSPANQLQFLLRQDGNTYIFFVDAGSGGQQVISAPGTAIVNVWQHVAGVWDGNNLMIYINGVLQATTTGVTGPHLNSTITNSVVMGYESAGSGEGFSGNMDEVRVWNRALCQSEIQNDMTGGLPLPQIGLVAYYKFDEGISLANNSTVTTLVDSSGNGYNGTLSAGFALNGTTSNWIAPGAVSGYCGEFIPSAPSITPTGVTTFCQGDSVILTASAGNSYSWSNGKTTQAITVAIGGNYVVNVTNPGGCFGINKDSVTVTVNPLPTASVTGKLAICAGTMDTLTANATGNNPFTYSWSTSGTNDTINVSSANTYSVTISDVNGCKNTASASVAINALPTATINGLSAVCAGTMDTLIANASGNSPFSYNWSTSSTSDSVEVSTANTYSVTVSDANGCKGTASASVTINPLPIVTITGNDSASIGHPDVLTANGGTSYLWTTGSTHDTTIVSPTTATVYKVTVTNAAGCSAVDSFKVSIKIITTGIAVLSDYNGTSLYPNPANTTMNLSFTMQGSATNAIINVSDITGKSMLQTSTEIANGKTLPIDISSLPVGIYFVRITTNKTSQTIKFVKENR